MTDTLSSKLGDDVRRAQDALLELRPLPPLARATGARGSTRPLLAVAAFGAAVAAGALVVVVQTGDAPPTTTALTTNARTMLTVVDARGAPAGSVPIAMARAVRVSDGSVVLVDDGARATLRELTPDRGFVTLEAGRVSLSLPRATARAPGWIVDAAPWRVDARGARVDVAFTGGQLTVRVGDGEAHVTSTMSTTGDVTVVRAGEERAWPETAPAARAEDGGTPAPHLGLSSPKLAPVPAAPGAESDASASDGPTEQDVDDGDGPTWQELARDDRHADAMNIARARVDEVLTHGTVEDVVLLATSARLAASPDVAQRALLAVRARAQGTVEAARAAFFLGVLADRVGDDDDALAFFARYAAEAPEGELASQAMGRALEVGRRSGKDVRDDARLYLKRWPDGAHADFARRLLGTTP